MRRGLVLAVVVLIALPAGAWAAPPPNDDFANATPIAWPTSWIRHLPQATRQAGEPMHAGTPTVATVWFTFTPDRTRRVALVVDPLDAGAVVAVYTGTRLEDLQPVGSILPGIVAGSGSHSPPPYVAWTAHAGVTYRIAVGLAAGIDPNFAGLGIAELVRLRLLDPRPVPGNDDFGHARRLPMPGHVRGNLIEATTQPGEPDAVQSVWFRFVTPQTLGVTLRAQPIGGVFVPCNPDDMFVNAYAGSRLAGLRHVGSSLVDGSYRFVARPRRPYRVSVDCRLALDYRLAAWGRPLVGATLAIVPQWKPQSLVPNQLDLVSRYGLPFEVTAWSKAVVAAQLRAGGTVMSRPAQLPVGRFHPADFRLMLTRTARRALAGRRSLDATLLVHVLGSRGPGDNVTTVVHLRARRLPSFG